jgi:phage baseplate assembly protein V
MRGASLLANSVRQQAKLSGNDIALPRLATISSYDPNTHAVKLTVQPSTPDAAVTESNWMPLGAIGIGNGWGVAVGPEIGDQVLVVYELGDFSSGTIVARIFSVVQQAPAVPSGEIWTIHKSGSLMKFHNDGKVEVTATSTMTYTASQHHFVGPVQMDNTLNVNNTISGEGGMTITGDNGSGNASTVTGNTNFLGQVSANGHRIDDSHKHTGVTTGAGITGTPQ